MKPRIILVPICIAILSLVALAQINSGANAFMNWSRKNIMRINTLDPGAGFSDLRALNQSIAYVENLELLEWMRRHNASVPPSRKIHFYGIDMSGQINDDFV